MIGNQRGSNWFCDHCKVPGHGIERCYKLHGYPPNSNWGKRSANLVMNDEDNPEIQASSSASPTITVEQYNQIMNILSK